MAQNENGADSRKLTAVYAPFKSFLTSLDYLREGLPDQLDVSVWPTFSGGLRGQLLAGYKFLGLVDENCFVQPTLKRLIPESARKEALKDVLKKAYGLLFEIDLARATPNQLADTLRQSYNVEGSTLEKAQTFFLHAARFAGIQLSPSISRKTRSAPKRKKVTGVQNVTQREPGVPDPAMTRNGSGAQKGSAKAIKLRGRGTLTLSSDVDFFSMESKDRRFVFDLIEQLEHYEQGDLKATAANEDSAPLQSNVKASSAKPRNDDPFGGLSVTDDDVPF
jgi:hypothetical protein